MSAKNILSVLIILGCLGAAGVILGGKLTHRAEVKQLEALRASRLERSYALVESLPLEPEQISVAHDYVERAHDLSFMAAYDEQASPHFDEASYMHLFVTDLTKQAFEAEELTLGKYFLQLQTQYPAPPGTE